MVIYRMYMRILMKICLDLNIEYLLTSKLASFSEPFILKASFLFSELNICIYYSYGKGFENDIDLINRLRQPKIDSRTIYFLQVYIKTF